MRTSAHARPVKIRNKTLFVRHLTQWRQFHLLWNRVQQRASKPGKPGRLPQSSSSMHSPSKRVQRTNLAERYQLRFVQFRATAHQIINPLERTFLPLRDNLVGRRLPQAADVTEPDAQTRNILVTLNRVLDGAVPFRIEGVDRLHSQAMQLRIVHKHCRAIKTNWLIVEPCRRERSTIMEFQVRCWHRRSKRNSPRAILETRSARRK